MKQNLSISEQDIFNYVFHPEILPPNTKNYLDSHTKDFIEQIEFCREFNKRERMYKENSESKNQEVKVVELYPINLKITDKNKYFTLAAASSELSKRIETKTFTDDKSQFLVRLVAADGEKKLYVFSKNKEFKEATLTLFPSQKSFKINSFELPIKIDNLEEIEKISIEDFN